MCYRSIWIPGVKKNIAPSHHVQSGSKSPRFDFKLSQAQQYITQIHSPQSISAVEYNRPRRSSSRRSGRTTCEKQALTWDCPS